MCLRCVSQYVCTENIFVSPTFCDWRLDCNSRSREIKTSLSQRSTDLEAFFYVRCFMCNMRSFLGAANLLYLSFASLLSDIFYVYGFFFAKTSFRRVPQHGRWRAIVYVRWLLAKTHLYIVLFANTCRIVYHLVKVRFRWNRVGQLIVIIIIIIDECVIHVCIDVGGSKEGASISVYYGPLWPTHGTHASRRGVEFITET